MGQAPNKLDVVQRLAQERADLFRVAHVEGHPQRYDFIKLLAATLHVEDARWGLNGKRGNPDDLSMDVVTWRVGPTNRHVEAFDVIAAAGGPDPRPVWIDLTNYATMGQPGTAVWVLPEGVNVGPPPPPDPPVTPPVTTVCACQAQLERVTSALVALTNEIAHMRAVQAETRDHAAVAAYESHQAAGRASEIKDQLERGFHADLRGRMGMSVALSGAVRPVDA